MALNISAWSIRNPLPSVVFSIILLVLGWLSFTKLAVTRLPSADIPVISVAVSQFGAAPAELESQVTKTIEDGVSGVEGVRHISSSITDGLSLTTIQFALETNTDRALNDVKDAVTRVRSNLPQNVNEPLIQRVDVIGLPIKFDLKNDAGTPFGYYFVCRPDDANSPRIKALREFLSEEAALSAAEPGEGGVGN